MTTDQRPVPEPGTRVRYTVEGVMGDDGWLRPDGNVIYGLWLTERLAAGIGSVEVLSEPVPDWANRVDAVVLDRDGSAWQRDSRGWRMAGMWTALPTDELQRFYGPLRLLHDPASE